MTYREWKASEHYLVLPIQIDAAKTPIRIFVDGQMVTSRLITLAETKIDYWMCADLSSMQANKSYAIEMERNDIWANAIRMLSTPWRYNYVKKPLFHYMPNCGTISNIISLKYENSLWWMEYESDVLGEGDGVTDIVTITSPDLLYWEIENIRYNCSRHTSPSRIQSPTWVGDISNTYMTQLNGKSISIATSTTLRNAVVSTGVMSLPLFVDDGTPSPPEAIRRLRVWTRSWKDLKGIKDFEQRLAFRIAPGIWPSIEILPAEGTDKDITSDAFEISIDFYIPEYETVILNLCGYILKAGYDKLECGEYGIPLGHTDRRVTLNAFIDRYCAEIFCGGHVLFVLKQTDDIEIKEVDQNVCENIEKCNIEQKIIDRIRIESETNQLIINNLTVYGLRSSYYGEKADAMIKSLGGKGEIFYQGGSYCVYDNCVSDINYGYPDAWVPDTYTVISPVRVTEEFQWRETPWGDMVRVIDRKEIWHPHYDISKYPSFSSGVASLDAAYNIALDTFYRCSSMKFALPGQEGMWSAGLFQGPGEGFGVWVRDTAHIALRCGNLIDSATARRTLLYTANKGFDNGSDGPAMAIVGLWDYYLATGDDSVLYEAWPRLLRNIAEADERFVPEYCLVHAAQSTSNDAFNESESGGFCLSTQIYYMKAYENMAKIGSLLCYSSEAVSHWQNRAKNIRNAIKQMYWNDSFGYYTAGPKGSESYKNGYWETSGAEGVVWEKFGIADASQRKSILKQMQSVAMTDYGIQLFPYKEKVNHFCGSIWLVWEAGFAAAAAEEGDSDLVHQLIGQQVRNVIMNKTFYEVIDADTGISWRWPGQLWHAAGFISLLLYGLFGISYDEEGLRFSPAVPKELANSKLTNLQYRHASLDIEIQGYGKRGRLFLNGKPCDIIPRDIKGKHKIILKMQQ
jgi:hypothetical protein